MLYPQFYNTKFKYEKTFRALPAKLSTFTGTYSSCTIFLAFLEIFNIFYVTETFMTRI